MTLRRIAILGAESSGKSTLARALAERHATGWVPEYLREFVLTRERVPMSSDQYFIASMQAQREDAAALDARRWLFCDTTPLMTAVYSQHYFGGADVPLVALVATRRYDLTIVTAPDSPWVADGLQRDSDEVRQQVHRLLLAELNARGTSYVLVSGELEQRIAQVDDALAAL
jgi:NadR type nicotinamide-nucleotide adenylyltransferase